MIRMATKALETLMKEMVCILKDIINNLLIIEKRLQKLEADKGDWRD